MRFIFTKQDFIIGLFHPHKSSALAQNFTSWISNNNARVQKQKNTDFKEYERIKQKPGLSPSPEKRQGLDLTCLDPVIPARRQARSDSSSERSMKVCACFWRGNVVQSLPRKPGHHSSLSWKLQATVPHTHLSILARESWQQTMIKLPNQKLKIKCDTVNIAFWPELHTAQRMTEVTCQSASTTNVPCNLPVASSAAQRTALKATVLPLNQVAKIEGWNK